jgi:hypothetical protein
LTPPRPSLCINLSVSLGVSLWTISVTLSVSIYPLHPLSSSLFTSASLCLFRWSLSLGPLFLQLSVSLGVLWSLSLCISLSLSICPLRSLSSTLRALCLLLLESLLTLALDSSVSHVLLTAVEKQQQGEQQRAIAQ